MAHLVNQSPRSNEIQEIHVDDDIYEVNCDFDLY